jgi:hypothetical protein
LSASWWPKCRREALEASPRVLSCPLVLQSSSSSSSSSHTSRRAQDPKRDPEAAAAFKAATETKAKVDQAQLVSALNEQIRERLAGNSLYRAGRLEEAMGAFIRAPGCLARAL